VNSPNGVGSLEEAMYLMLKGKPRVLEINNRELALITQRLLVFNEGNSINLARILTRLNAHA
jgi:hypothetical protein